MSIEAETEIPFQLEQAAERLNRLLSKFPNRADDIEWKRRTFGRFVHDMFDSFPAGLVAEIFGRIAEVHELGESVLRAALATDPQPQANGNGHQPEGDITVDWEAHDRANRTKAIEAAWPKIGVDAYYGLAGLIAKTIEPNSEADPVAVLAHVLVMAGNLIGNGPFREADGAKHHANLYAVIVGASAKARKGTALERVRPLMHRIDPTWAADRIRGGLSSGEGFAYFVRDPVQKWNAQTQDHEIVDPGAEDKRLMVTEPEFAGTLSVCDRPGNTVSPLVRKGWDGQTLSFLTKNSPIKATGAHISIVAHITEQELKSRLTKTDQSNGFANRFMFFLVKRSKLQPFSRSLSDSELQMLTESLSASVNPACGFGSIGMTDGAEKLWAELYRGELSVDRPGLLGDILARSEAQTLRLALVYALLDGNCLIDIQHLKAALAVWRYCVASATRIFGDATGDVIADDVLLALKAAGEQGMSRNDLMNAFSRHRSSRQIGDALQLLEKAGRARAALIPTGGRSAERWYVLNTH